MTNLEALLCRKTVTVLGINTGTSIDGLDFSAVRIQQKGSPKITPLLSKSVGFSAKLRAELIAMASQQTTSLEDLTLLDEALGKFIGQAASKFISVCRDQDLRVDFIASHGQTVRHHPELEKIAGISVRSTLQIGSPERIAAATKRLVVSHFRQADTAIGGEGAPITTEAVYHCLRDEKISRLIVNIGGIANFFYLPAGTGSSKTLAEDIGPGNLLLDQVTQILFDKPFDKAGSIARSGNINERLLKETLQESFFVGKGSKNIRSTGREQYGSRAVKKILKRSSTLKVGKSSILTTLTELTALKIYRRLSPMLSADKRLDGIYLTGGGAKNTFLVKRLRALFAKGESSWEVRGLSELAMHPDSFEATCFAVLGWMSLYGIPAHSRTVTMKSQSSDNKNRIAPILGRIVQAPMILPDTK